MLSRLRVTVPVTQAMGAVTQVTETMTQATGAVTQVMGAI